MMTVEPNGSDGSGACPQPFPLPHWFLPFRSSERPLSTHCRHSALAYRRAMSKRSVAFTLANLVLLFAAMFYSGMFMHGD